MTEVLEQSTRGAADLIAEMPIAHVVEQLNIALGEFLTVIISDAGDTPTLAAWKDNASPAVRAWIAGTATPPNPDRLRFALEIVRKLSVAHGNSQIHAWFGTVLPAFGEMPARVIARRPLADIRRRMLESLPR